MFLLLGLAVFALERFAGGALDRDRSRIEVTAEEISHLDELWSVQTRRSPSPEELEVLIEDVVREEILVREAMRLGLDRDDTIVRRRLAQKMSFLIDDTAEVAEPTESELETYFATHSERYREPRRTTFFHVFLSRERHGEEIEASAHSLLERLEATADDDETWRRLGDPFMLRRQYAERSDSEIAELFGGAFAEAVGSLEVGSWTGPLSSAYGLHLVRVLGRTPARAAELVAVRSRALEDLRRERREQANREAYERLRGRYRVVVERP